MRILKLSLRILLILSLLILVAYKAFNIYLFDDTLDKTDSLISHLKVNKVMIVFAHPDDESYVTGLLNDAEQNGVQTALLTFTPGDAGEQQPQVCQQKFLGEIRKAEVYKSGFMLGVDYQKVFSYGDGTLQQQNIDTLTADILYEINKFCPDLIITFWPESGMTMHPDHMAIGKATRNAWKLSVDLNETKHIKLAYTIMPPKVLKLLGNKAMLKLQPEANLCIMADASIKTELWDIHASQKHFVKNYTGIPAWLLYRLLNREYYYMEHH